jgi:hypothetical protein
LEDPYAKWGELVGALETIEIPGAHMDILREPHVGRLAEYLKGCIDCASLGETEVLAGKGNSGIDRSENGRRQVER